MAIDAFEKLPEEKRERIIAAGISEFACQSYQDVKTDVITSRCGISKGILFHYFGSKKGFYLYCLKTALERLMTETPAPQGNDFYTVLFDEMEEKMNLCRKYREETHMVNMASRDLSSEIAAEKAELMKQYMTAVHAGSAKTLKKAMSFLVLKGNDHMKVTAEGLQLYISAILNAYLRQYQQDPAAFFADEKRIRRKMKEYIDLMLYGICEKETI